jgi:hypothetical protein
MPLDRIFVVGNLFPFIENVAKYISFFLLLIDLIFLFIYKYILDV